MKVSNRFGFPLLEAVSVASDGTNTTVTFNPVIASKSFTGGFWVKIPSVVATSTEPLQFATNGVSNSTVPVYLNTGAQATVASIASTDSNTYHLMFYDTASNKVQLIS